MWIFKKTNYASPYFKRVDIFDLSWIWFVLHVSRSINLNCGSSSLKLLITWFNLIICCYNENQLPTDCLLPSKTIMQKKKDCTCLLLKKKLTHLVRHFWKAKSDIKREVDFRNFLKEFKCFPFATRWPGQWIWAARRYISAMQRLLFYHCGSPYLV